MSASLAISCVGFFGIIVIFKSIQRFDVDYALIYAALFNNVDSISKLADSDINAKDNNGDNALIIASANNSVDSISKLVELGADIEAEDNNGNNTLIKS